MNVSIVIPTYNEEKNIRKTVYKILKFLKKENYDFEIIIIDDNSKDKTQYELKKIKKNKKIRILKNKKNMGKGYSVKKGILNAKKDYVLFSDADLSTPIKELKNFEKYLNYDIVIASRALKESKISKKQPILRIFLGKIFNLLVQIIALKGIKDTQCGFKLLKKDVAKNIFSKMTINRWGFDVEMLFLAKKNKYLIKEVPVEWINDENTKLNPVKDSMNMLMDLLKIRYNNIMGKYK